MLRQLPMRTGWWDALHAVRDFVNAIRIISTMRDCLFFFLWAFLAVMSMPYLLHIQLCFPSEPILNRFLQRLYQELPLNHNIAPIRTYYVVSSIIDSTTLLSATWSSPNPTWNELAFLIYSDILHHTGLGLQQKYV